jgi:hypothetical protein
LTALKLGNSESVLLLTDCSQFFNVGSSQFTPLTLEIIITKQLTFSNLAGKLKIIRWCTIVLMKILKMATEVVLL